MYRSAGLLLTILFLSLVLNAQSTVLAQSAGSTTASITGTVTDEMGALIPGASVTAKNLQTNLARQAKTGEDGSFFLSQLPPGTYEVTVQAESLNTKTSRLDLILGNTTLRNFSMKL